MPDPSVVEITERDISAVSGTSRKRPPLWRDPVATTLVFAIALAIIGALLVAVFAILNGTIRLNDAPPATLDQALKVRAEDSVKTNKDAESYADLIIAQVDQGDIPGAQVTLQEAEGKDLDVTATQALEYAKAYIYKSSGRTDDAIKLYQTIMDDLKKAYDLKKAEGGDMNWALAYGLPSNYYMSASQLANYYHDDKDYDNEIKYLNIFLEGNPTDATALIDRGNAYLEKGNKEQAKQDFQNALKYIPNDADATAGLKKAEGK
jgi:tetratricopeptide (TPR) repeat protein